MGNITIDELFDWAAQQPPEDSKSVQFAMTTNELSRNNLASYAEGTLVYHPSHGSGMILAPAAFSSVVNGVVQYFSDRRYQCPNNHTVMAPFDCGQTDYLTVIISRGFALNPEYSINLKSTKWNFESSFVPRSDLTTGVLTGVIGQTFITVSLCNRNSSPSPR